MNGWEMLFVLLETIIIGITACVYWAFKADNNKKK